MIGALRLLFGWLASGPLDRILSTVDKRIAAETDREALKADIIKTHYATRADFMRAGGFWLMLIFALPLGVWFAAVCIYSIFLCAKCMYPVAWSIAALPAPLDQWAGAIVTAIFGVVGLSSFRR